MIASLRGRILEKHTHSIILEVAGVGYKVFVTPSDLSALRGDTETFLYTYHQVKEDGQALYGFTASSDLSLFERLIQISGVGPKVALALLSLGGDVVREGIMKGAVETLSSAPGVGKKTAQKIVLELKGQLVEETPSEDTEAFEALKSLGYSASDARDALKAIDGDIKNPSDRIREALRLLSRS